MDVTEAVERLHRAHTAAGLGRLGRPGHEIESALDRVAAAIAPWQLPADLLAFWRGVDANTLAVAPCPGPADPILALRLWQEHFAGEPLRSRFFPWCYGSHDFMVVELAGPQGPGDGCFSWSGGASPIVRTFPSVTAYLDLLATMVELHEFVHHPQLGVIEFDPARCWNDAQVVRLAAASQGGDLGSSVAPAATTVAALLARAEAGESPCGVIRARVVSLSGSASGKRIHVTDATGRLDLWCPASLCTNGPVIDRLFDFEVSLRPGHQLLADDAADLSGIVLATRKGDLKAAVMLATPLYDRLFGAPATAQARAIRPVG